jgi:hypothetical protein
MMGSSFPVRVRNQSRIGTNVIKSFWLTEGQTNGEKSSVG